MNFHQLRKTEVQNWIESHKNDNIHSLAFQKSPFDFLKMQELLQQVQGRKIAQKKFPILDQKGILFPPKLNLEQTSSQRTAEYKASLMQGETVVDATGGFGIDSLAFAKKFQKVYHVEQNEILQQIASTNFEILNFDNIESFNQNAMSFLENFQQKVDVIYLDPSRRSNTKERVFLLQDLSPNVLEVLDDLKQKSNQILIKLSPLIDLDYLLNELNQVSEIHVVALKNEVKEVLVKITSEPKSDVTIIAVNLDSGQDSFSFQPSTKNEMNTCYSEIQRYLYQPNVAIIKAGGNDKLATKLELNKLHPNTQLYTSDEFHEDFPGRVYEVGMMLKNPKKELKNKSIMAIHKNYPESLMNLKKKFKFTTDGVLPILFTKNLERNIIHHLKVKKL